MWMRIQQEHLHCEGSIHGTFVTVCANNVHTIASSIHHLYLRHSPLMLESGIDLYTQIMEGMNSQNHLARCLGIQW